MEMEYHTHRSYRDLIKDEFEARNGKNKFYSLRAFGRDLGVSSSYLSMIFSGLRHPSVAVAVQISKALGWDTVKQEYFLSLLELENPKTQVSKELAKERISNLKKQDANFDSLKLDFFTSVAHWHYMAIYTLLTLKDFKGTVPAICQRLNLDLAKTVESVALLERIGFIYFEDGLWHANQKNLRLDSIPSEAIRNYHKDVLHVAEKALDQQSFEQRDFANLTMTVDPTKLDLAKKKVTQFQFEMSQLLEGDKPSEVYQLSIQLFKLTQPAC